MSDNKIIVKNRKIRISDNDYICITDIAKYKDYRTDDIIKNWLRNRTTIEFLGIWERINNKDFNPVEFDGFRKDSGLNSFVLTPKQWIDKTKAIGIISKAGRYGGTYAHKDIAFEFSTWISVEFKLYLIKEFQRLREEENKTQNIEWNLIRNLSKINYRIHTDSIKEFIIPEKITKQQQEVIYSSEADLLNVALFGLTAKEWKSKYKLDRNIREHATTEQLIILSNLESLNSILIRKRISQAERIKQLNETAIYQMKKILGYNLKSSLQIS